MTPIYVITFFSTFFQKRHNDFGEGYQVWFYDYENAYNCIYEEFYWDDGYYDLVCIAECEEGNFMYPKSTDWYNLEFEDDFKEIKNVVKIKSHDDMPEVLRNVCSPFWAWRPKETKPIQTPTLSLVK